MAWSLVQGLESVCSVELLDEGAAGMSCVYAVFEVICGYLAYLAGQGNWPTEQAGLRGSP